MGRGWREGGGDAGVRAARAHAQATRVPVPAQVAPHRTGAANTHRGGRWTPPGAHSAPHNCRRVRFGASSAVWGGICPPQTAKTAPNPMTSRHSHRLAAAPPGCPASSELGPGRDRPFGAGSAVRGENRPPQTAGTAPNATSRAGAPHRPAARPPAAARPPGTAETAPSPQPGPGDAPGSRERRRPRDPRVRGGVERMPTPRRTGRDHRRTRPRTQRTGRNHCRARPRTRRCGVSRGRGAGGDRCAWRSVRPGRGAGR